MSVDTVINWAIHTGIDVSILIIIVLICRRPFVRIFGARSTYALWLLPFIRLVFPQISVTLPRPKWMEIAPNVSSDTITIPMLNTVEPILTSPTFNWLPLSLIIWLSGTIIWITWQLLCQIRYKTLLESNSTALQIATQIQHPLNKSKNTLNLSRTFNVRISNTNIGPLVTGILKPIIILPRNFEKDYTQGQQYFALIHELAHIKRRDLWGAMAMLFFRALNWPNPLVHYAANKFRIDQEAACDAYVLKVMGGGSKTKQSYAATLIHSAKLTRIPTPTPLARTPQLNPLCLSIHHPLKERLMTLKTAKTKTTLLSRVGIAAIIAAALTITAPITIASAQDNDTQEVKTKTKKVISWLSNDNGVETKKTFEVTTENGVTTAYSIDQHGNKTLIEESEIAILNLPNAPDLPDAPGINTDENMSVFLMSEGSLGDAQIRIMGNDFPTITEGAGHKSIFIHRSTGKNGNSEHLNMEDNIVFMNNGPQASKMVSAARELLNEAEKMSNNGELSSKARKKLKKAHKALAEAQEALESEE